MSTTKTNGLAKRLAKSLYGLVPLKPQFFGVMKKLLPLPERIYRHLHFQGVFKVKVDEKSSFLIRHYGYQVENDLFWAGYGNGWEGASLKLWAKLAKDCSVILDIGANTGVYSLAAKAVNPNADVHAFEPLERIAQRIVENDRLNNFGINTVIAGVGDSSGEAIIFAPPSAHSYSASLNPTMLEGRSDLVETRIPVTRIDDFAKKQGLPGIDLVKLDAEKYEAAVLAGFGELIARYRPVFLIEILDADLGRTVDDIFGKLEYKYFAIDERLGLSSTLELGADGMNYLLCPAEKETLVIE